MDPDTARRSATSVGLITLAIGMALVFAPSLAGRLRWQWMTARAGLNLGIAAYCLRLVRRERATGAMVGQSPWWRPPIADRRTISALRRGRNGNG